MSVYEDMAGALFVLFLFGALLLLVSLSPFCHVNLSEYVLSEGTTNSETYMPRVRLAASASTL